MERQIHMSYFASRLSENRRKEDVTSRGYTPPDYLLVCLYIKLLLYILGNISENFRGVKDI